MMLTYDKQFCIITSIKPQMVFVLLTRRIDFLGILFGKKMNINLYVTTFRKPVVRIWHEIFFNLIIILIQKLDDVISFYGYRRSGNWLHISEPGSQFDDSYKLIFRHRQGYVLCSRVSIRTCFMYKICI